MSRCERISPRASLIVIEHNLFICAIFPRFFLLRALSFSFARRFALVVCVVYQTCDKKQPLMRSDQCAGLLSNPNARIHMQIVERITIFEAFDSSLYLTLYIIDVCFAALFTWKVYMLFESLLHSVHTHIRTTYPSTMGHCYTCRTQMNCGIWTRSKSKAKLNVKLGFSVPNSYTAKISSFILSVCLRKVRLAIVCQTAVKFEYGHPDICGIIYSPWIFPHSYISK